MRGSWTTLLTTLPLIVAALDAQAAIWGHGPTTPGNGGIVVGDSPQSPPPRRNP